MSTFVNEDRAQRVGIASLGCVEVVDGLAKVGAFLSDDRYTSYIRHSGLRWPQSLRGRQRQHALLYPPMTPAAFLTHKTAA